MGAHGFQLCWASHALIFGSRKLWGRLGRTLSWEIEAQALFLQVSVTSLIYKAIGKSSRAGTFLRMPTAQPSSQSLPLLIDCLTPSLQGSESPNVASLSMSSGSPVVSSICWSWITGLSWICFQEKIKRYILGDDICTVTGELGQGKAVSRLTFEKRLVGRERLETIPHLGYIQETNGVCSRKTCDNQKLERQVSCKWPIKVPETHGPALSEWRSFPGA